MSINDDILSRELKHRALLSLYEKKLDTDLTKVMSSHKKRLVNSTLKNGMKGSNALNRALGVETRKTYRRIYREGIKELKALAKIDSRFQASTLNKSFGKIYRSKVYTGLKVNDLIINSSGTYGQQIASISLGQQRRIKQIVKEGMIDNLAVNKIADNIGKTVDLPKAQLRTLSRTAITETSTNINNATYKLNEDVLDGYQYVATLDSRTSLICANLDGKTFRLSDKRGVRPPQHFNCRSTTIPIVKSHEDLMNTDSNRISKRRLKRMTKGKRASFNGQVPADTKFEDFFARQDNDFKLAVLGSQKRVDIYNTGKLKFSQFSTRDGKLVSISRLDELLNNVKPSTKGFATTVATTVNKPKGPIYGNTTDEELKLLTQNYGTEVDEFSKGFKQIKPLTKLQYGSGEYSKSADRITIGSLVDRNGNDRTKNINWRTTVIHELAHRYDDNVIDVVMENVDNYNKLTKGFVSPVVKTIGEGTEARKYFYYRSIKYDKDYYINKRPNTVSELAIDSMIDDYIILTKKASKRSKEYTRLSKEAYENSVGELGSKEYNDYFRKLNKSKKSFLSDDDIRDYIYHNRTTDHAFFNKNITSRNDILESDIYNFKLKLENKTLSNSMFSSYDRDFRGEMNDYIGSITSNTIGAGHTDSYYRKFQKIGTTPSRKQLTEGNTSEAYAEYVALLRKYPDKKIRDINRKIAEHYAPNTTKAFDVLTKRIGEIYE